VISISIHNNFDENLSFKQEEIIELCTKVLDAENCDDAKIDFILKDREFLNSLKKKYFKMDVYTDVMAFNLGDNKNIDGEVYISIEDVLENSKLYSKTFNEEFSRIVIHGLLHLLGYDDKTKKEKDNMTLLEEKYLLLLNIVLISIK
jgi:rRNA maturation RNase YbeY|tara:strand:+ start:7 stop:447 length:441 start_codon:yes stop_codon:yes gene_type:complete